MFEGCLVESKITVTPAHAEIHNPASMLNYWISACAGMTKKIY